MGLGKILLNPVLGGSDALMRGVFHTGQGVVSGLWSGLSGKGLKLSNVGTYDKLTRTLGYSVGKTLNVTVGRPVVSTAWYLTKNTPKDFVKWSNRIGAVGRGTRDTFFKKATKEEIENGAEGVMFGYKARAGTPLALTAGAIGIGVAQGAGEADYNLGLRTAVNGVMDSEGVAITPGSINPSYTPVHGRGVSNHGATGELPLALHKQRTSGFL